MILLILCSLATFPLISGKSQADLMGKSITLTNVKDSAVITVHKGGNVTGEVKNSSPEQIWSVDKNPHEDWAIHLKQKIVPLNELSGFKDDPANPGLYPRPITLVYHEKDDAWNLQIRRRWCLQSIGIGLQLDRDECETATATAPNQLWKIAVTA